MRDLNTWLDDYSVSHKNPTNKKIHNICVPLIMFSLLGMMWEIPLLSFMKGVPFFNWATLFISFCMIFYFMLGMVTGLFMVIVSVIMLSACFYLESQIPLLKTSIFIFVLAWVGQFIGHKIEGKKPSFFEDLQFLLVGPLWVFHPWYKRFL